MSHMREIDFAEFAKALLPFVMWGTVDQCDAETGEPYETYAPSFPQETWAVIAEFVVVPVEGDPTELAQLLIAVSWERTPVGAFIDEVVLEELYVRR